MDEHRKNGHQEVRCAMCQQTMQKHLLEFHEGNKLISPTGLQSLQASDCDRTACLQPTSECQERPIECMFCEAAVSLSKLEIHEHHCSSRTELCQNCGQLIVLHALAQHRDVCQSEQAQLQREKRISAHESNICCHYCKQMIPENKFLHHMDECHTTQESTKYSTIGEPRIAPPSLPSQAAEDQTSTEQKDVRPKTKNTNRLPLLYKKSTRQAPSGTNETMDLPLKSEHKPWVTSPVTDEAAYDILRRCPQCDILLPLPTLNQHQEKCWWLASSKGKQVRGSS